MIFLKSLHEKRMKNAKINQIRIFIKMHIAICERKMHDLSFELVKFNYINPITAQSQLLYEYACYTAFNPNNTLRIVL